MSLKIAIVGGGLGGLAAANALLNFGFEVDVFEQAPALGEVGAGIQMSPQAAKSLIASGYDRDELIKTAWRSNGIFTRDMNTGEDIFYSDWRKSEEEYGVPFLAFHRADLLDLLARRVDPKCIHLDHKLTKLEQDDSGVTLMFENGNTHRSDILIGADGIHSTIRNALYGNDSPKFINQVVWRTLVPASEVPPEVLEPSGHIRWVGEGRQFYAYYLRNKEIVSIVTQQEWDDWVDEGWATRANPDEMRAAFPNPEPRLEKLLSLVKDVVKWGVFLREPTDKWGEGRVLIIGDAAHAMLPNAGQGAGQSFEDAYILARWLDKYKDDYAKAFSEFKRVRMPRVHAVQNRSAKNASAKRLPTPEERKAAFQAVGLAAAGAMDWILKYEPEQEWDKDPVIPPNA